MSAILLAVIASAPPWTFHDADTADGRSVLTYRTVELADKSPGTTAPAGSRFGVLPLGLRGGHRVAVVWHVATNAVWLEADHDGTFAATEKHTLADAPLALKVPIPFAAGTTLDRTVLLRRRGDGLAYAVRGYLAGSLTLGTETYPARLTDGNADGCFDDATADRLWIDRNRDGTFDPLAEQFPLGKPVTVVDRGYLVRPDPLGRLVSAVERSTDAGTLVLDIARLKGAAVAGLTAVLVSEWGELVTITDAEKPVPVPVGRYRLEVVKLRLTDANNRDWRYTFVGPDGYAATVRKGEATTLDLTAGAKASAVVGRRYATGGFEVTPAVTTTAGLSLTGCERLERFAEYGTELEAVIDLEAPGSESVYRVRAGFF